jgi:hypothetical protein
MGRKVLGHFMSDVACGAKIDLIGSKNFDKVIT